MAANVIWGSILILLGISLLAKSMLRITIPIIRILLAGLLIYAGVSVFTQNDKKLGQHALPNHIQHLTTTTNQLKPNYGVLVGDNSINFSGVSLDEPYLATITALLGKGSIMLPKNIPVKIVVNTAFGQVSFPDNHTVFAGAYTYQTANEEPLLTLHIKLIVGNLEIVTINEGKDEEKRLPIT